MLTVFSTPLACTLLACSQNDNPDAYAKLNGDREEVDAGSLRNGITARNARQVDEGGLDNAGLALQSLDDALGESTSLERSSLR